jgi:alpha-L-fucosidase
MDGAKGKNARDMEYDFNAYRSMVYNLQPQALIFSDVGPDIRWIGNEHGIAGFTNWSTISTVGMKIGDANTDYLNTGDPAGTQWLTGECDVSIRPGWFYHASQDTLVKSPEYLVDLYYKSVGRNGTLLLNLPPDRRGLIHENDIRSLEAFHSILSETFNNNLMQGGKAEASSQWSGSDTFNPQHLLDDDHESYWAADPDDPQPAISIKLPGEVLIDRILLQEPIRFGQRIAKFSVEANLKGKWAVITEGTTIGHKRLLRFDPVTTERLRITITEYLQTPALSTVAAYKASSREKIIREKAGRD